MQGYIKIHRKIQECWLWQDKFSKGQAWIDLLLRANHKDNKIVSNSNNLVSTTATIYDIFRECFLQDVPDYSDL